MRSEDGSRSQIAQKNSREWFMEIKPLYPIQMVLGEMSVSFSRHPSPTIEIEIKHRRLLWHSDRLEIIPRLHRLRDNGLHVGGLLLLFRSLASLWTPSLTLFSVRLRSRARHPGIRAGPRLIRPTAENLVVALVSSHHLYRVTRRTEGLFVCRMSSWTG